MKKSNSLRPTILSKVDRLGLVRSVSLRKRSLRPQNPLLKIKSLRPVSTEKIFMSGIVKDFNN
jgi:hypothetical protein